MFVPSHYAAANPRSIIRDHPFAAVVTTDEKGMHATATPVFFETMGAEEMDLVGHIARRNPQADGFHPDQNALLIFSGPNAYISGAWYRQKPQVPTWNYIAAQVQGTLTPLDDSAESLAVLQLTAERLSSRRGDAWHLEDAPQGRVEALLPHIRSFRVKARAIEGVEKLSQTHPQEDRLRVIANLAQRGESGDLAIARLMAEREAG
ncbi:FMN-binding negative transcriptional regulator [Aquamicrobium sp. LC103]|uniref:FMN-binding negative transcriptional regulator n=1 Tax=Aquamicrobium sp. LC103 TaxID=1120658 RepID=UPI000B1AB60B|nr:FMN-binding negative transcriptional regulator [Aquamicrobium sp. LC103]